VAVIKRSELGKIKRISPFILILGAGDNDVCGDQAPDAAATFGTPSQQKTTVGDRHGAASVAFVINA
jgi:hypothetical protein